MSNANDTLFGGCNEQSININKRKILGTTKKGKMQQILHNAPGRREERYEVLPCPSLGRLLGLGMDRSGPLGKFIKQCISQELAKLRLNLVVSAKCGEKKGGADTELQS